MRAHSFLIRFWQSYKKQSILHASYLKILQPILLLAIIKVAEVSKSNVSIPAQPCRYRQKTLYLYPKSRTEFAGNFFYLWNTYQSYNLRRKTGLP